jgi:hypothetical protein
MKLIHLTSLFHSLCINIHFTIFNKNKMSESIKESNDILQKRMAYINDTINQNGSNLCSESSLTEILRQCMQSCIEMNNLTKLIKNKKQMHCQHEWIHEYVYDHKSYCVTFCQKCGLDKK